MYLTEGFSVFENVECSTAASGCFQTCSFHFTHYVTANVEFGFVTVNVIFL